MRTILPDALEEFFSLINFFCISWKTDDISMLQGKYYVSYSMQPSVFSLVSQIIKITTNSKKWQKRRQNKIKERSKNYGSLTGKVPVGKTLMKFSPFRINASCTVYINNLFRRYTQKDLRCIWDTVEREKCLKYIRYRWKTMERQTNTSHVWVESVRNEAMGRSKVERNRWKISLFLSAANPTGTEGFMLSRTSAFLETGQKKAAFGESFPRLFFCSSECIIMQQRTLPTI